MKRGFIGILNNPASSLNSHSAGWNLLIKDLIDKNSHILSEKDNWDEYDELIINHGPNFKPGSFNVIGGINDKVISRLDKLINFKGKILQIDGFQTKDFIIKRKIGREYDLIHQSLSLPNKENLVIGDSHSISVWPNENYFISRNDGKTLHGFLKQDMDLSTYKDIILYFGNIDIRFHICRQENPLMAIDLLIDNYINYAKKYNATIVNLLPIESESRILPGTGTHKGKNFFGSRENRADLVDYFNLRMNESGLNTIKWPSEWYENIEFYEKEVMEPKSSVHIRPKFYKRFYAKD